MLLLYFAYYYTNALAQPANNADISDINVKICITKICSVDSQTVTQGQTILHITHFREEHNFKPFRF